MSNGFKFYCIWSIKSEDISNMEFWYNISCRPHNFVTKLEPSELSYCPYCGNLLKIED